MSKNKKNLQENSVNETPKGSSTNKDVSTENSNKKDKKDKPKKDKKPLNTKKLKYGTLATVFTVIVVAIVVAINIIAQDVTERFDLTMDLTDNDIYTVSQ